MPKLFVVSDIHGFYNELIAALADAGFDESNEDHWLITCGDHFDRGPDPNRVMKFLMNLPRKILIKGNHEQLLDDLCQRGYSESHDYHNGTIQTALELGSLGSLFDMDAGETLDRAYRRTRPFFNSMVNYFETENYIFVHSWIPTLPGEGLDGKPWHTKSRVDIFNPEWRNGNEVEWEDAVWGNPFKNAALGLNQTGKTIVFGHWHCSYGWAYGNQVNPERDQLKEYSKDATWEPYYGDGFIAIDRCTALTKQVNVLVLEDEFIYD